MGKNNEYLEISKQIVANIGGMDNIQGTAHCATRLRIVLKDNDLADIEKLEDIDKVKGAFIAGNQLQLILGAGTVNDVYEVFAEYTNTQNMSLGDLKEESAKRQNPLQAVIKALSDVFIGIMPALLAAALLMGITSVLGGMEVVKTHDTLYAINRLVSLASTGIFAILPMAVCYSAVKRFGGNPVLGMVIGAIMLDSSLANAYQAAQGTVDIEVIRLFGLKIEMVGFQGGIIIALMMGFVVAKLDKFFNKVIPDVIKLLVAPMLTVFISTVLLFTLVGPAGRILSNHRRTDVEYRTSGSIRVCVICRSSADRSYHRSSSHYRCGRSTAYCIDRNKLFKSTDVCSFIWTKWCGTWLSFPELEELKSQRALYSKFLLDIIWYQ